MKVSRLFLGISSLMLLLVLSGCMGLPQKGQPVVVNALTEDHDLRFLEILSARRLWRPEKVDLEGYDAVWCVTAYGENDEDEFEVYLWVTRTGEQWSASTASESGFERMNCIRERPESSH